MLDWTKIENPIIFQRLISQLVSLECHTPGFLPSSPYIGADGGYDAYVDKYPEENISGEICIQAKYTKHNLKDAYNILRTEMNKELKKAKKNRISHLILATNAELSIPYIKKLLKVNKFKDISLRIWDREQLTLKIEKQPFLKCRFFNYPAIPLFVPATTFFEEVENKLASVSLIEEVPSINNRINEFISFLNNEKKNIFILQAPGGYGKSHFLREIPKIMGRLSSDREVWFIRIGVRDIQEAFNDEIGARENANNKHKYLFVLDDTDRVDDIENILLCITNTGIDAKLVLALRTSGMSALDDILISTNCRSQSVVTSIPQWTDSELNILLKTIAKKDDIKDIDLIVRRYRNPFFIVKIGERIRDIDNFDYASFKETIVESVISDSKRILSDNIDADCLLLHLSLISPINISDTRTIDKLSEELKVDVKELTASLHQLGKSGVLRSIGNIFRFTPDMTGDVFLLDKMHFLSEGERKKIFLYWFDTHSKNIFCNLGSTIRYGDSDYLLPILNDVISSWITNTSKYDDYDKRLILENLEAICAKVPDKSLDLLWAFLDNSTLTTDAYGPVINKLIHSDFNRSDIIKIIVAMINECKGGTYDNYKPSTLIKECVCPLDNDIESQILPSMSILEGFLNSDDNTDEIELLKVACAEILASAHEFRRSSDDKLEIGSKVLNMTDHVIKMRDTGVLIIKKMLKSKHAFVRIKAVEVIESIGKGYMGLGPTTIPLKDKIIAEREDILCFIVNENIVDNEKELDVLSTFEDLVFHFWARKDVPDEIIVPLFDKFTYTPEYRIFRYYSSRWGICGDVKPQLGSVPPSKERWNWAVDNLLHSNINLKPEDFTKEVIFLNQKYSTPSSIAIFLHELNEKANVVSATAPFLREWFKHNPEAFKLLRFETAAWSKVPLIFKYTIFYDLVHAYPEAVKRIIDEVLLAQEIPLDEAKIALDIFSYDLPGIDRINIADIISNKKIDELNLIILEKIRSISKNNSAKEIAEITLIVLKQLSLESKLKAIYHIAFILFDKTKEYKKEFLNITGEELRNTLISNRKLDHYDFEILSLIVDNVNKLVDFINVRLEKENEVNKHSEYEAVPFDGITIISKRIKNIDDYLFVLKHVLQWDKKYSGLTYYSVSKIFDQIATLRNESNELYLEKSVKTFFNKQKFRELLDCLFHLPLIPNNMHIFADAISKSKVFGYEENMTKLLRDKLYPEGGWFSSVGETPKAFIDKKNVFKKLAEVAPRGLLKNCLEECLISVDKMINKHKDDEENRFHSK
ncbi:MAG: hypothetical protein P9M13_07015 [Candidatus Ancaeobacter aquaticus]|nr:hypothetical protein [Candidatus Ancaeobacter aquaticus]